MNAVRRRTGSDSNPFATEDTSHSADQNSSAWSSNTTSYYKGTDSYQSPASGSSKLPGSISRNLSPLQSLGKGFSNCLGSSFSSAANTESNCGVNTFGCENPAEELDSIMTCRDRSSEFAGILRSQQNSLLNSGTPIGTSNK